MTRDMNKDFNASQNNTNNNPPLPFHESKNGAETGVDNAVTGSGAGEDVHDAFLQESFFQPVQYISGHRHPDTDSIAAAMAYEALKIRKGENAMAVRLGEISPETRLLLERFGLESPPRIFDVRTQVRDIVIDHPAPIGPDVPLWAAWAAVREEQMQTLPVTDGQGHLLGIVTGGDIAEYDMNQIQSAQATAHVENLLEVLKGALICGERDRVIDAPIYLLGNDYHFPERSIVLGDNLEMATLTNVARTGAVCYIACGSIDYLSGFSDYAARHRQVLGDMVILTSAYELYKTLRLVALATSVSSVMNRSDLIRFHPEDYLDDVRNKMLSSRFRTYPVVDRDGHFAGMISRFHLIRHNRKRVILVDHNEISQSFPGIEQAEVTEIIDHHRIGDVTTDGPIFVRNVPVGSTSTIITQMYEEQKVPIDPKIAGLLLAAILSDTIFFQSPTCTAADREAAAVLARVSGEDIETLAGAMFSPSEEVAGMPAKELLRLDFKVFRMSGSKVGISQINVMDISSFLERREEIIAEMDAERKHEDYDMMIMVLTDIRRGGSQLLLSGSLGDAIERAYGEDFAGLDSFWLPGVLSRKKQIVPALSMVVGV